jgi:acetylornithine deacetylase
VSATDPRPEPDRVASDSSAQAGQALSLASALVRIPSVNPLLEAGGAGEAQAARQAARWLAAWGFETDLTEPETGRYNVIARHPAGRSRVPGRTLLFNGHLDTVGVAGMVIPPFGGDVRDGRLHGRGSCDMKGGVGALLSAAAALARSGHEGTLLVALTADEEHASLGMQALVSDGVRADAAVVCEPTELAVMPAHKGFVWLKAVFRGRAAHGSRPDVGIDAVRHAALYIAELEELTRKLAAAPSHPLLGQPSFHVGTIQGGSAPSVYPESCEVVLERRMLPGEDDADVEREFRAVLTALKAHVPEVDATIERTLARPGTEVGVATPLVRGLLEAASAEGVAPRVEGMTAWVDAALLNEAGIPAVCFGPGSISKAHSADEWAPVDEIERCARILERFGRDFLAGTTRA